MNKTLKYTLFLFVLGIIVGGLLAGVNSLTAPIIEERARQAVIDAMNEHFDYEDYSVNQALEYPDRNSNIESIYYAFDDEGSLAAVIYQIVTKGYENGEVTTLIGIRDDGTFEKVIVVEAAGQTAGIGDKIIGFDFGVEDDSVNKYSYNTISGATISAEAVHKGIDIAAAHFKSNDFGGITNE